MFSVLPQRLDDTMKLWIGTSLFVWRVSQAIVKAGPLPGGVELDAILPHLLTLGLGLVHIGLGLLRVLLLQQVLEAIVQRLVPLPESNPQRVKGKYRACNETLRWGLTTLLHPARSPGPDAMHQEVSQFSEHIHSASRVVVALRSGFSLRTYFFFHCRGCLQTRLRRQQAGGGLHIEVLQSKWIKTAGRSLMRKMV